MNALMKTAITAMLVLIVSGWVYDADAAERRWYLTANAGIGYIERADDGTWWQEAYPNQNDKPSLTWGVGAGFKFSRRVYGEVSYQSLGRWDSTASYIADDALYQSGACFGPLNGGPRCQVLDGKHNGFTDAIVVSSLVRFRYNNLLRPYVRTGIAFTRSRLDVIVYNKDGSLYTALPTFKRRTATPVIGVGVEIGKRVTLELSHYVSTGYSGSLAWSSHTTFTGGIRW